MRSPVNYLEWTKLFAEIQNAPRDEAYIEAVAGGTISFTSGVAERFVKASSDMITGRINHAQDAFQKQMRNARGALGTLGNALTGLKKEYRYAYQLALALPIPEPYHRQLADAVLKQAAQTESSLMDSAKGDRTGHLTSLVRNLHLSKLDA